MGSSTPAPRTLADGVVQAAWYAARLNLFSTRYPEFPVSNLPYMVGTTANDPSMGIVFAMCGNSCRVTFTDGIQMTISYSDAQPGVLVYQYVNNKKRPAENPITSGAEVQTVQDSQGRDITSQISDAISGVNVNPVPGWNIASAAIAGGSSLPQVGVILGRETALVVRREDISWNNFSPIWR